MVRIPFGIVFASRQAGDPTHVSACTKVLYTQDNSKANLTFVQVLKGMRQVLRSGNYSQIPQLTSSRPLDMGQRFYIVPPYHQGTKRAVLIGINYTGQNGELSGCHNDCLNMKDYIKNVWGFSEANITMLMDDGYHKSPTRYNILKAYKKVAAASKSGDAAFCHYSGKIKIWPVLLALCLISPLTLLYAQLV